MTNPRNPTRILRSVVLLAVASPAVAQPVETWVLRPEMSARKWAASAYDPARGRVVVFGGLDSITCRCDTWEWDGAQWIERYPTTTPPSRYRSAMAYDAARGRVVMFGGSRTSGSGPLRGTWEWDGFEWRVHNPAVDPGTRSAHAMAYDPVRQRVVLFGGSLSDDQTWEWDGASWSPRAPATTSPSARINHAMAWDPVSRRVLMFGGRLSSTNAETWAWDGNDWTQLQPAISPGARTWHGMATDPVRQRVVMFGGFSLPGGDTWEWDGVNWRPLSPAHAPTPRWGHTMAFDGQNGAVLLAFGGDGSSNRNETWLFDGSDWSRRDAPPLLGLPPAIVEDPRRGRVVMFGWTNWTELQTWEWNGHLWEPRTPRTMTPPVRGGVALAYHVNRRRVMLFGGDLASGRSDALWEWDGADWTPTSPATRPSGRSGAALTYDAARDRLVMFGGFDVNFRNDTWEWDGNDWTQRTPANSPGPTSVAVLAYDAARNRSVLISTFGTGASATVETWEWDGNDWTQRFPSTVPSLFTDRRVGVYDPRRGRVVLVVYTPRNDMETWEWDGNDWLRLTPPTKPTDSARLTLATDSIRGRLVLFTGDRGSALGSNTWLFGRTVAATQQRYGSGCSGTAGVPHLDPRGRSTLGNPGFALDLGNARRHAAAAMLFAATPANLPFGGCTVLVDPSAFSIPLTTDANGFGTLRAPVPGSSALIGATVHAQGVVLDPNGAFGLVSLTNGVRFGVGD